MSACQHSSTSPNVRMVPITVFRQQDRVGCRGELGQLFCGAGQLRGAERDEAEPTCMTQLTPFGNINKNKNMRTELTEQDQAIDPPLLTLPHELAEVGGGVLHVSSQNGVVGTEVGLKVGGPVLGVRSGVDDGPDVLGGVAQCEALEVQDLDSPGGAWGECYTEPLRDLINLSHRLHPGKT